MTSNRTIGQLASAASVNVETVRYYERRGLIPKPVKPAQGYRSYPEETLSRILFIKRSQELGFTLEEIDNLLLLGDSHCTEVQSLARNKLESVRSKLIDLQRLESVLDNLLTECQSNTNSNPCPIVESLIPKIVNPA